MSNFGYGYKLKLDLVSPYNPSETLERIIFVPVKNIWARIAIWDENETKWMPYKTKFSVIDICNWEEPKITPQYSKSSNPSWSDNFPTQITDTDKIYIRYKIEWNNKTDYIPSETSYYDCPKEQQNIPTMVIKQYCYSEIEPDENSNWTNTPVYYGNYQTPKNIKISEISLFDGGSATIDYKAHFNLNYLNTDIPRYYEAVDYIQGQISGVWESQQSIGAFLKNKYYAHIEEENNIIHEYCLNAWSELTFEGIPTSIDVLISFAETSDKKQFKLDKKGLYNEVQEIDPETNEEIIKKIYSDPDTLINECTILSNENKIEGNFNYKAHIMQKTYI